MAITRAQQVRQMLEDGGMLVSPSMTGKRPGYRGEAAAASDAAGDRDAGRSDTGSASGRGDGPSGGGNGGGNGGGDDRRERFMGLQGKTGKVEGVQRNTGLEQNRLSNIMKMDRFTKFRPEVKIPNFGLFGIGANLLKKPIQNFADFTASKNRPFFGDVVRAGKYQLTGDLAKYGKLDYGDLSEMTDEELEQAYQSLMSDRNAGEVDAFGNPLNQGDDGPDNTILFSQNTTPGDGNDSEDDDDTNTGGLGLRYMSRGGSPMDAPTTGGIMDLETGRQMYFLGKLVKKATRAVKKIAKSPIGKAAILGTIGYGLGGGTFFGKALPGIGTGGGFSFKNILPNLMGVKETGGVGVGFEGILGKLGLTKGFGSAMPTVMGGITLASLTPLLFGQQEDDEEDLTIDRGPKLDIPYIRGNPYTFRSRIGDGTGLMTRAFQDGGSTEKEPVAKKTMPLLDMDGKEMDLREDGGFVPIGRMEKADDVPARLSKNEFVFTADAVRNAGEGDVDKGAEVMYNMMKNLESGGEVSEESQGLSGARKMFQTSKRLEEVL